VEDSWTRRFVMFGLTGALPFVQAIKPGPGDDPPKVQIRR